MIYLMKDRTSSWVPKGGRQFACVGSETLFQPEFGHAIEVLPVATWAASPRIEGLRHVEVSGHNPELTV